MRRVSTVGLCAIVALLCAGSAFGQDPETPARRVLFIGNSLTAANDLPGTVETLARVTGGPRIECRAITFANFSLEDHWNQGDARRAIREGGWSVVVLQQGPSALPESRVLLVRYAERFAAEAEKVGARTALYAVWPSRARSFDVDGVAASYAAAAEAVDGLLLPAGSAWTAAWKIDPELALHGADGFHPSPVGSLLAAVVIYQRLSGEVAIDLGRLGSAATTGGALAVELDASTAGTLTRAASSVASSAGTEVDRPRDGS
jgi:hypothetical protein